MAKVYVVTTEEENKDIFQFEEVILPPTPVVVTAPPTVQLQTEENKKEEEESSPLITSSELFCFKCGNSTPVYNKEATKILCMRCISPYRKHILDIFKNKRRLLEELDSGVPILLPEHIELLETELEKEEEEC